MCVRVWTSNPQVLIYETVALGTAIYSNVSPHRKAEPPQAGVDNIFAVPSLYRSCQGPLKIVTLSTSILQICNWQVELHPNTQRHDERTSTNLVKLRQDRTVQLRLENYPGLSSHEPWREPPKSLTATNSTMHQGWNCQGISTILASFSPSLPTWINPFLSVHWRIKGKQAIK